MSQRSAKIYNYEYNTYKYKLWLQTLITNISILALDPFQCETELEDSKTKGTILDGCIMIPPSYRMVIVEI